MTLVFSMLIGVISWPVLEYILHRFLGHDLKVKTVFKKEHTRHHAETNYFAPAKLKIISSVLVITLFIILINFLIGDLSIAISFTLGFAIMYGIYEYTHWSFHTKAPKTKLGLRLRKHHFSHHFHNTKMNHGVTSTWIDKLMGTYKEVDVVKVPKSVALPWLFEKESQTPNPKFTSDFVIK
jgi:sterol desaturase/sphingolipid hydroxylase (fatty acid hydroxylase superfamily)